MGKIKQGILGGFKGKVGTVIGASWNGIAYMRGLPQSIKNPKTAAQQAQRAFFREVQDLVGQLSYEQLVFLFPESVQGMSRRNLLVKQLSAASAIEDGAKHVNKGRPKVLQVCTTPTICVFNVTQKKIFLVHSTVTVGASGVQSFSLGHDAFGIDSDEYSGFMLSTGGKIPLVGFGTLAVATRPERPPKKNN